MHWATKYIGLPYRRGGRDESGLDCWGLLRLIYEKEFHITLPDYPGLDELGSNQVSRTEWIRLEEPENGCAVAMGRRAVIHVGVVASGKLIIHCWNNQPVVGETITRIHFRGLPNLQYYRHILWPG